MPKNKIVSNVSAQPSDTPEKIKNLLTVSDILLKTNSLGKKTIIFGNGGSAAIASHFSVDITKNAKVRCTNYNESDLLTCFSNDFGYENWVKKSIEYYADEGDLLILLSCSGNYKNLVNAQKKAASMGLKIAILTGLKKNQFRASMGVVAAARAPRRGRAPPDAVGLQDVRTRARSPGRVR